MTLSFSLSGTYLDTLIECNVCVGFISRKVITICVLFKDRRM
jgi:hypothetical protein